MKYLFDSSAIFRAVKEDRIELLNGTCTLELARYELGNIMWKDYGLQAKISAQESKMLMKALKRTLDMMDVLGVAGNEEEILETALQLTITFYDASYVYFAKAKELQLITEDSRLIRKIVTAMSVSLWTTFSD
jgi:predicted nucleic acid-binding protein